MKLNKIKIQNFIGIESADLDLSGAKIHCFVGPNGAGKSTIQDACRWCLLGTCRGRKTKDQMADLVRNGQKKAIVEVFTDLSHFKRSRTQKTIDKGIGLNPEIDADYLRIVLDSYDFLNRSNDSQKLLLNHVLGLEKPDKKMLQDRLGKTPKHKELIGICINHGFEKAESEAVMSRREAKRALQEVVFTEPSGTFEGRGMTYHLADIEQDQARIHLEKLKAERTELLIKKGEIQGAKTVDIKYQKTVVARLEKQLKDFKKGKDPEKFKKEIAELKADIKSFEALRKDLTSKAVLDRVEQCPIYGVDCLSKDLINEMIEESEADSAETSKKIREYDEHIEGQQYLLKKKQGALADAEESDRQYLFIKNELVAVLAKIEEAEKNPPKTNVLDIDEIDKQLSQVNDRIDNGENIIRAIDDLEKDLKQYQQNQHKAEVLKEEVELYDEAAKFFSPSGILEEILSEGIAKVNNRIYDVGLLPVELSMELKPILKGCPLPSGSEEFRIGVVIQEAISFLTGTRLLFIDKADILDPDNRSFLIQSLYKIRDDYDTIMVFSTVGDKKVVPSPVADIQMWLVDGGRVSKINKEA